MDYPPKDDPNHLGMRCIALPEHQMALITSGCVPFRCKLLKPATPVGVFFENVQPLAGSFVAAPALQ